MGILTFLIQLLQSFTSCNELQILLLQFLESITELLTKIIQSLIVGIACPYIREWFENVLKKSFKSDNQ